MSLLELIAQSAPLLADAISSTSPLAGIAVSLVTKAFGVDNTFDLENKIRNDPESALKLKQLEFDHVIALEQIAAKNFDTSIKDKADARETFESSGNSYQSFICWFALLVGCGFFGTLGALFLPWVKIDGAEKEILLMLVGVLISKFSTIIDFFYGSSNP